MLQNMAPAILIAGATGNTGQGVVATLPKLLSSSKIFSKYRIIAVTRTLESQRAQQLAKLPEVEVIQYNWVEITADWLREHQVARAFIASHNDPNQFAEESAFHVAALNAGLEYVVRISTTAANVHPNCRAYYPRSHWAIETLLDSPEFARLQWTSLQPNIFSGVWFRSAAEFIKQYTKTGRQDTLKLIASKAAPVGIVDPFEVGVFAAHLLSQDDPATHNKAKYVLNGPEDITGGQIVGMVEQHIGTQVKDVIYNDVSFIDSIYDLNYEATKQSRNVILSIKYGTETAWEGKCSTITTSREVSSIAPPKRTPTEMLNALLAG
ncbi:hypothetical protein FQN57_000855 [Myotisia sp. PD_48]|nr:hypothetical protein FQN57_000855 [Myotisia sp. PD_48]